MTRLNRWTALAVVLVATLITGMAVAQNPGAQAPKAQDEKIIEGTLMGIDQNARLLTLKAGDKEMQFSFTDQTELVGPEKDGQPAVVAQGTKMRVHYTEHEKTNIATKIEIIETAAAR